MDQKRLAFKAIAAVAGIDAEGKVHGLTVADKSIKHETFITFMHKLRKAHEGKGTITLFVDNLNMHYMKVVKQHAEMNDINLCFNAIYASEYNPVERLWLFAKRTFSEACITGAKYHDQSHMRKVVFDSILGVP